MKRPKRSTSATSAKKTVFLSSNKDGGEKPLHPREDPRGIRGKANREAIRQEARRVNVPRQSKRPAERSK